ncbi:SGNH/GDSL hydrolase family protein [Nocardioides euryhalodurans]|uniref:SGNH/GDSL hydrolase family protein n=1 Tax=Nocardioides euryhalodurans TaxID=2518370 RepID=A0A4V1BEA7_9ACTN|nr:SGNH/GDSL hydrolase family protein [Nocardioides euryhalodurans]QBR93962.1 SGNH/GDSL hydrolase family protein [Nocardioides euryhalodurans]
MHLRGPSLTGAVLAAALLLGGCSDSGSGAAAPPDPAPSSEPTDPPQPALSYVALGDSFTAAPGIPETDTSDGCLRSSRNYPALVAEALESDRDVTLADRSCSAADTTSLAGPQEIGREALPPQLDALDRDTDLVTLSMGGNDFGVFLQLVGGCVSLSQQDPAGSPCADAAGRQGDLLTTTQQEIEQRLVTAVREIQSRAPRAQVLLVGYPQLAPAAGECPDLLPLASGDLPFARTVNKTLTDNLARAAERTGTTYVDVWSASAGHDICADAPWVNGQVGQQGGAIPFHPLPAGQQGVADLVVAAVEK